MKVSNLRFVERDGNRILQMQVDSPTKELNWAWGDKWIDVPLEIEKVRDENGNA